MSSKKTTPEKKTPRKAAKKKSTKGWPEHDGGSAITIWEAPPKEKWEEYLTNTELEHLYSRTGNNPWRCTIVVLRARGNTWNDIARKLQISAATVHRWRDEWPLDELAAEIARDTIGAALLGLGNETPAAVGVIRRHIAGHVGEDLDIERLAQSAAKLTIGVAVKALETASGPSMAEKRAEIISQRTSALPTSALVERARMAREAAKPKPG